MFNKLQWYVNDDLCSYKVDLSKKQLTELPFEYDTPDNICHYGDYILGENKSSDTTTVKNKILDLVVPLKGIEIYAFPCLKSYFNQLALPTNSYKNIIYNDGELLPNPPQWRPGIKHGGVENAHEQNNISTLESARTNDISRSKRRRPRYPGKCTMESRLDTFTTWSHSAPTPQTLAADGFFFTGDADFVRCHQCGIELKDFSPFGDPLSEHIKHAGSCDFLTDLYGITGLEQKRIEQTDDPSSRAMRPAWTHLMVGRKMCLRSRTSLQTLVCTSQVLKIMCGVLHVTEDCGSGMRETTLGWSTADGFRPVTSQGHLRGTNISNAFRLPSTKGRTCQNW
ncbi:BIR7B-like protein [Mya arenaria]|uniref:BIR7B-like protein n=1 Tax=Mya arenaria TaxID=6604 RepID=A0ABY7EGP0_MYAAR|nr:BIR7B-like protein [Mya arenaria]